MPDQKRSGLLKNHSLLYAFLVTAIFSSAPGLSSTLPESAPESAWPEVTRESRPWAYWWWLGSAVKEREITRELEMFRAAGLGGVHIIPIYGAKGWEDRYVDFLSPRWMAMLSHTGAEADRLGMGVDMSVGTGWPFGGPWVTAEDAAKKVRIKARGRGAYEAVVSGTGQMVKRAAPSGEGLVMDYFSERALTDYLAPFDAALATMPRPAVRAFYNDSFEAYGADWTDDFFAEFRARRGYDLADHLDALAGRGDADYRGRVLCDYRETLSDLLLEKFTIPWVEWTHRHNAMARDQAHGSPANILDLYAAVDVPETEAFGPPDLSIPGLAYSHAPASAGRPDPLVMKFASSAAHVAGRPLVSSETGTWLGEHFTVSLAHMKPELDMLFTAGINHVFYHGIAYSPASEPWPGWLFYAATNFGPSNTIFRDLPAMNAYVGRVQSFLQPGGPDNDVLLYWPVHDLWSGVYDQSGWRDLASDPAGAVADYLESGRGMVMPFTVHNADKWLHGTAFGQAAEYLWNNGYAFDYVSDRMVQGLTVDCGTIRAPGGDYRAIVVPYCRFMPLATMEKLAELSQQGAAVIFIGGPPRDMPGLKMVEGTLLSRASAEGGTDILVCPASGTGRNACPTADSLSALSSLLSSAGVPHEPLSARGLWFIRRAHADGRAYFIFNPGPDRMNGWIELGTSARSAIIFDPLFQTSGAAALRTGDHGALEIYLQLDPGQSHILRTFDGSAPSAPPWPYLEPSAPSLNLTGPWRVEFIEGGPTRPAAFTTTRLASWTELGGPARDFSGTARYTITFTTPAGDAADYVLDLGDVRNSAKVRLNGLDLATLFSFPFRLRLGPALRPGENTLEIEVTNLMANRIAFLDRRRVPWKKFHNINFVSLSGLPFNASLRPPLPSGLIGPVRLIPCSIISP
ncbi:MAG TPA: glycosyl hydrolase [bacterium]|nr:glycosyl hydrolase [bacterium]